MRESWLSGELTNGICGIDHAPYFGMVIGKDMHCHRCGMIWDMVNYEPTDSYLWPQSENDWSEARREYLA